MKSVRRVGPALLGLLSATALADPARPLTLEEALQHVGATSEEIELAQASYDQASARVADAKSPFWPQITGAIAYTHTFESQFSALATPSGPVPAGPPPCAQFM